ncbi:interleukin-31 receptor subunit alpha-like [Centroberyx affinis]|uniref:interleukin-31 receptor subunit alpha-like n=1 Tax=Centroberyx affinis TaxID=166261 RepID=UPI003A5C65EB
MYSLPVLCILGLIPAFCTGQHEQTCNVIPKDRYIEMGSDVKITCQSSCTPGKIYWTLNNVRINDSLSETISSSYTVLQLRHFTQHSATLQCHSFLTRHVLGGTTIRTYSKPSNISCILQYNSSSWPDDLTCSWEHQINSPLKINYTLRAECVECKSPVECPCFSETTSCGFKCKIILARETKVIVTAKTAAWEAESDPYTFFPLQILKIPPPEIQVTVLSTNHLLVEWDRPHQSGVVIHCEVKYNKALNEGTAEVLRKSMDHMESRGNVTTREVEFCTNYTVSARCAEDKGLWSDWSQKKTVLSKINKSAVKLGLWRKVAEPDSNGLRKVHAMWTEIPPTCQGEFHYTIHPTPYKERISLTDGMDYTATSCGSSTCDVNVTTDAHRISLSVSNNGNLLAEESIYVPAIGESLPEVNRLQTTTHEDDIQVSWKAPGQPVSGYMIDWTHDGVQYFWKESKHTSTTLFDLLECKPYNITVTPLFDNKTGLGTQDLEICSSVGAPETISLTDVVAKDKSALVSWNMESQKPCSGVVVNYTVFYKTDEGPQLNVTVDGKKQEVLLKDLKPGTHYIVYVMAMASTGNTSSIARYFETKRYDPSLITALSVCGGIVIFLVLSLGLFCAVQWKKFREKRVPNPGLSTLALWPSQGHYKVFPPFSNPSESLPICDTIYPCEPDATTTCTAPPDTDFNDNANVTPASEQTEEKTDPACPPAPGAEEERPVEPAETPHAGETAGLLASGSGPLNPYRSQSSAEPPAPSAGEQCKRVPALKQQSKTAPLTAYVTLNMFEQGQGR